MRQTFAKYCGLAREHLSDLRHCVATPCYAIYENKLACTHNTPTYLDVAKAVG